VRLNPPYDLDLNPIDHFLATINDVFEHVLHDVQASDMVGVAIRNEVNQNDIPIGSNFWECNLERSRKGDAVEFDVQRPRHIKYRGPCG
jgi:hypothetical protein